MLVEMFSQGEELRFSELFGIEKLTENYVWLGTGIIHQKHYVWIQYQATNPEQRSTTLDL